MFKASTSKVPTLKRASAVVVCCINIYYKNLRSIIIYYNSYNINYIFNATAQSRLTRSYIGCFLGTLFMSVIFNRDHPDQASEASTILAVPSVLTGFYPSNKKSNTKAMLWQKDLHQQPKHLRMF